MLEDLGDSGEAIPIPNVGFDQEPRRKQAAYSPSLGKRGCPEKSHRVV